MTTPPSCTLVTACYDMHQYNPKCRTIEESIKLITPLLKIPVYLVIYGSKNTLNKIECIRNSFGFQHITKYICQELEELWTYQFLDQVKLNRQHFWPTRDERTCSESHIVCCNKFDFVLETIYTNPFNTTHFGWIDAFLGTPDGTKLRVCENYQPNTVPRILHQIVKQGSTKFHIQQLNVNDTKFLLPENKREFYMQYRWVVCGGFFVTAPEAGLKILNRLKEVFVQTTVPTVTTTNPREETTATTLPPSDKTIEDKGRIIRKPLVSLANAPSRAPLAPLGFGHGEEMFYLEILDEFPDDLHLSYGDYGQILDNFITPTANIEYVYHTIIKNLKAAGHTETYKKACQALRESADNYYITLEPEIYNSLL
jgi:hypothetical protein